MRILRTAGAPMALFLLLAAASLAAHGLIVRMYMNDVLFLSDSIWRASLRQVAHLDFESPIGQAFYWPYAIVGFFSGGSLLDVLRGNVIVGAVLLLACLAVFPARFSRLLSFLATAIVLTTAMTGRSVDGGITTYDFLAPYNRWGWSFAIIAALIALVPPREPRGWRPGWRRPGWLDGSVLGFALTILFYLKISVFVYTLALVCLAVPLRFLKLGTLLVALAIAALLAVAIEVAFGNNAAYLADLGRAARANLDAGGDPFRIGRLSFALLIGAPFGLAAVAILFVNANARTVRETIVLWWREIFMVAATIGAAAFIGAQNHPQWEVTMYGAALVAAAELGGRKRTALPSLGLSAALLPPAARSAIVAAALALGAGLVPAMDAASIVAHAVESNLAAGCTSPSLRGTSLARLLFPRPHLLSSPSGPNGKCSYLSAYSAPDETLAWDPSVSRRLLRTVPILRTLVKPGDVILALEFANPYPFVFRTPPPEHALIWMDYDRTYSRDIHPAADALVGQADYVVQTDYPAEVRPPLGPGLANRLRKVLRPPPENPLGHGQDAWNVYGAAVRARFVPVARTAEVTIWRRRGKTPALQGIGGPVAR